MQIIQDLMTILQADEGYWITDGQGNYGRTIYLGIHDSPSNWYEVNEEEVPPNEQIREDSLSYESEILGISN